MLRGDIVTLRKAFAEALAEAGAMVLCYAKYPMLGCSVYIVTVAMMFCRQIN